MVPAGVHADHMDAQGLWPNAEVQQQVRIRQQQSVKSSKSTKRHLHEIAARGAKGRREMLEAERSAHGVTDAPSIGIPPEAQAKWAKDVWVPYAEGVFTDFLRTRAEPFTTAEDVWPLLYAPEEKRAMALVTQRLTKAGAISEVGAKRLRGIYRTRDGVAFAENKLVPIYVSLLCAQTLPTDSLSG